MRVVAAAALACAASVAADWTAGDVGIDRPNGDLLDFFMKTNSTQECFDACAETEGCIGWAMQPSGSCGIATCWLKWSLQPVAANPCRISGPMPGVVGPAAFSVPPVGRVKPAGWLQDELQVQALGLSGHLALFWPDIQSSVWIGGTADTGLHERGPYWLNGVVPLAFQTNSSALLQQVAPYLEYILSTQAADGWLGPDDSDLAGDMYWARSNVLFTLLQHWEATADARIIPSVFRYLEAARMRMLGGVTLGDWSAARGQDLILTLWYLLDAWPAIQGAVPAGFSEAFLVDTADVVHDQMLAAGMDWKDWFDTSEFPQGPACNPQPCSLLTHGVNIAQAIKSEAVWWRRSGDPTDVASTYVRVQKLDTYHGAPTGLFQADEHLAGPMPSHGTELCAVVEYIFSASTVGVILGAQHAAFFERAEQIAYNGLPATLTKDMWAHQYLQQANEVNAASLNPHVWITDGPDSTIYGLAPNYGCCTANYHQGWPKFVQRMVLAAADGGIAIAMWGPVEAAVPLQGPNAGTTASVSVDTDFPFGDTATITVSGPAGLRVSLRVPSWCSSGTLTVSGSPAVSLGPFAGSFYNVSVPPSGSLSVGLDFAPAVVVEGGWFNGSVAIRRGALLYALQMGENVTVLASYAYSSQDLQVLPTTPFNLALVLPQGAAGAAGLEFQQLGRPQAGQPFSESQPPVAIRAQARLVPSWGIVDNAAAPPPASPVPPAFCGSLLNVTLVPYGSTLLRMSVLPYTLQ